LYIGFIVSIENASPFKAQPAAGDFAMYLLTPQGRRA
jgi:hypothetical protein